MEISDFRGVALYRGGEYLSNSRGQTFTEKIFFVKLKENNLFNSLKEIVKICKLFPILNLSETKWCYQSKGTGAVVKFHISVLPCCEAFIPGSNEPSYSG